MLRLDRRTGASSSSKGTNRQRATSRYFSNSVPTTRSIKFHRCLDSVCQSSPTCRILAGWPLRNSVTAPRPSGHQSRNRPIFFARSRSSLVLKPLTVFASRRPLINTTVFRSTAVMLNNANNAYNGH